MDEAVRCYDALLSLKPGHQAWYNRECCVYLWLNLRRPWREFSPDVELDPEFKVRKRFETRGGMRLDPSLPSINIDLLHDSLGAATCILNFHESSEWLWLFGIVM